MMRSYDVVIVGAGLFGSTIARLAADSGLRPLVLDRREHIGGNCWSYREGPIDVHAYGPHVIHTDDRGVWSYFERFATMFHVVTGPIANYQGKLYNLPFNMNTFYALWGVTTPEEAKKEIESQRVPCDEPRNLEEHVLNLVGRDVYEKLVKGYTEKQYGKPCSELPASLISRMPLLFTFENDYLRKRYQGVPEQGYEYLFQNMLKGIDVELGADYLEDSTRWRSLAPLLVYTGPIDEYFGYRFGELEYRGRKFEHVIYEEENHQGVSFMNYTDADNPCLRSTEHKHFTRAESANTVVTYEYAVPWHKGDVPYYSVNDAKNQVRYKQYLELSKVDASVVFGGRLGEYRYYTMSDTVQSAFKLAGRLFG